MCSGSFLDGHGAVDVVRDRAIGQQWPDIALGAGDDARFVLDIAVAQTCGVDVATLGKKAPDVQLPFTPPCMPMITRRPSWLTL